MTAGTLGGSALPLQKDGTAVRSSIRAASDGRPVSTRRDPEARLIFALAGPGRARAALSDLGADPSWERLLGVASLEHALFALHELLRGADPARVPMAVQRQLAFLVLERAHRMRVLERRLETSVRVLNDAGIEPVLLKGAALAATVYGGARERPMNDIDLLVEEARAAETRELMIGAGWEPHSSLPEAAYGSHHHLAPLLDAGTAGLRLEIHRALLPAGHPFRFTMAEIHSAAIPIRIGTGTARVLPPTEHAVQLGIHFVWSHMLSYGAWHTFRDLATLDRAGLLDWSAIVSTARRWGAASCCYWTLRLGRELAQLQVPEPVLRELQPRLATALLQRIERHFAQIVLRADHACPSRRLRHALWTAAVQPDVEGHNAARPWSVSVVLPATESVPAPLSIGGRLRARLTQTGSLVRYLASMR